MFLILRKWRHFHKCTKHFTSGFLFTFLLILWRINFLQNFMVLLINFKELIKFGSFEWLKWVLTLVTSSMQMNCCLFMCSWKWCPRDCVIKLRDNQIFKTLLWIKKSFKSIDFDLAKHALVSNVKHRCNLFEKHQILKLRWAYWKKDLAATS